VNYWVFISRAQEPDIDVDIYQPALRQLDAGYWGLDQNPAVERLKSGDQALIYLAAPHYIFIGRATLATAARSWPRRKEIRFGPFDRGVTLSDVVFWEPPLPRHVAGSRVSFRAQQKGGSRLVRTIERSAFFSVARLAEEDEARWQPWLPELLERWGATPDQVSFLVVEDVSRETARVAVSAWPAVDTGGMLRLDGDSEQVVDLPVSALKRTPRQSPSETGFGAREGVDVAQAFAVRSPPDRIVRSPPVSAEAQVEDVSALAYDALAAVVYKVERATQGAAMDSDLKDEL
jgi:hypothetical protein